VVGVLWKKGETEGNITVVEGSLVVGDYEIIHTV